MSVALQTELADSIQQTLRSEARRNELLIAWVRVVALALTALLDLAAHLEPEKAFGVSDFPLANAEFAALWCLAALVLAIALQRGWYREWIRVAAPLLDGLLVLALTMTLFLGLRSAEGPTALMARGAISNVAAVCTLLAVTGSLRLSRSASLVTTSLAVVDFAVVGTIGGLSAIETAFVCSILVGTGLLGAWMTGVVLRAVESEVGRMVLSRFLPTSVIRGAHHAPLELVTAPRQCEATILITDIRGFTSYAEKETPDNVLKFLNQVQGLLASIVTEEGGTIDKFMGDGMLAVFGAVDENADHPSAAVRAAARMQNQILDLSRELGREIRLGIGVHTGHVIVGCLGSGARLEFTTIGDPVNTASRLETLTKELKKTVLISETTAARVRGFEPPLEPLGEVSIRGRKEPLRIFTIREIG